MIDHQEKNTKIKIIPIISTVVGLIIISLLILGGSLLASKQWNPRWNPFSPSIPSDGLTVQES